MRSILAIDTAGSEGSVALTVEGKPLRKASLPRGGHSEELAGAVKQLLQDAGFRIRDLAGVAVAEGPGSFTGLRIGLAWAKGLAWGAKLPLLLVPSHEALALTHAGAGRNIATLIPAERGRVGAAVWKGGAAPELLWGPEPIEEDRLLDRLLEIAGGDARMRPPLLIAPLTPKIAAWIEDQAEEGPSLLAPALPLAPAVAAIAARLLGAGQTADWVSASPAYGRAPNARKPAP